MRRIARAEKPLQLLRQNTSAHIYYPQICSICKLQATFSSSARRTADAGLPLTEKIRRKIWGTDQPPGPADPYGKDSHFDHSKKAALEQKLAERNEPKSTDLAYSDNYQPANTWEGLEHVGDEIEVQDSEWLPGNSFKGSFIPKDVLTDGEDITAALHRTIVEIFVLQQEGESLSEISRVKPGHDLTRKVQILYSKTKTRVIYSGPKSREAIIRSLTSDEPEEASAFISLDRNNLEPSSTTKSENGTAESANSTTSSQLSSPESDEKILSRKNITDSTEANKQSIPWDSAWKDVPITDPEIKLAIMKRMIQLSGIRIPDATITATKTVGALLAHIVKPPKPRKLVEALAQNQDLLALPNVSVYNSRITTRDKERAVGRWKLIEDEFRVRGLLDPAHAEKGRNNTGP